METRLLGAKVTSIIPGIDSEACPTSDSICDGEQGVGDIKSVLPASMSLLRMGNHAGPWWQITYLYLNTNSVSAAAPMPKKTIKKKRILLSGIVIISQIS